MNQYCQICENVYFFILERFLSKFTLKQFQQPFSAIKISIYQQIQSFMQISIQTDRYQKKQLAKHNKSMIIEKPIQQVQYDEFQEREKERRINRLSQMNKQLIYDLKQQNDRLTQHINKNKGKLQNRSLSLKKRSVREDKQIQKLKMELQNAHRQIDMYKETIKNIKCKQAPVDSIQKVNHMDVLVRNQDNIISQLQKQIKYYQNQKEQQLKQIKTFQNDEVTRTFGDLNEEIERLKGKIKASKKAAIKRQQIAMKQHQYQMELQDALKRIQRQQRQDNKKPPVQELANATENQWTDLIQTVDKLKAFHEQNGRYIQKLKNQKVKQYKSIEENQLKFKQKERKFKTLKNKYIELAKLVKMKPKLKQQLPLGQSSELQGINHSEFAQKTQRESRFSLVETGRDQRKWAVPQSFTLEKGKIVPDSIFFSDKTVLKQRKKSFVTRVHTWIDQEGKPCILQFYYRDQQNQLIQGVQPITISMLQHQLTEQILQMTEGDYLSQFSGAFVDNQLVKISFKSKFSKEVSYQCQYDQQAAQSFSFTGKTSEVPTCFFGAYIKNQYELSVCHIGCQFSSTL